MGTISKDKGRLWSSLQVKFSLSYILIMAAVLVLLNTYPILVSEDLVFRAKETSLQNSVSVMVYSLSGLDHLTEENVSEAMAVVEETGLSRILVTDSAGKILYDTRETNDALGEYSFYTEIVQALMGNDIFSISYRFDCFGFEQGAYCTTHLFLFVTRQSSGCFDQVFDRIAFIGQRAEKF